MTKSIFFPALFQALIHCAKLLPTHCGNAFTWGAQVRTIFGREEPASTSVIVITSVRLCRGCSVALYRLTTRMPAYLMNCFIYSSLYSSSLLLREGKVRMQRISK